MNGRTARLLKAYANLLTTISGDKSSYRTRLYKRLWTGTPHRLKGKLRKHMEHCIKGSK